jgi:hypothetical protein
MLGAIQMRTQYFNAQLARLQCLELFFCWLEEKSPLKLRVIVGSSAHS